MAKKKTVYLDVSGNEHLTEEAANQASAVREAAKAFWAAANKVSQALLGTAKTGDGQTIDMLRSGHYWHVHRYFHGRPCMRQLFIWPHLCEVVEDRDGAGVSYRVEEEPKDGVRRLVLVPISQLYASKSAAEMRYIELMQEMIAEATEEIEDMKKRVT